MTVLLLYNKNEDGTITIFRIYTPEYWNEHSEEINEIIHNHDAKWSVLTLDKKLFLKY